MEVISILDLGAVRVAELLVQVLLLRERLVGPDVERQMVTRAGAESPAARPAVRFMEEHQRFGRAARPNLEPMIGTVDTGLPEAEGFYEEAFFFFDLAHRQDGAMEAACGHLRFDLVGRPPRPRIV